MENHWRTINIFLSSTFSDMQSERDIVRKVVVPRLNEILRPRKIAVIVTDLRWGIETSDSENEHEREAKVLHVCINSIKNTRPYFVALIGERYGWVPDNFKFQQVLNRLEPDERNVFGLTPSPCSVTEMEIMLGAIGDKQMLQHSCFCFRDAVSYEGMGNDEYTAFVTGQENEEVASKLKSLKSKIKKICEEAGTSESIVNYKCRWDRERQRFVDLGEFARSLEEHILKDVIGDEKGQDTVNDSETDIFDNFFASNAYKFIGREQKLNEIRKIVTSSLSYDKSPLHGIILHGSSGVGKSYFLSALSATIPTDDKTIILTHAAGLTSSSVKADSMFRNWSNKLQNILHDDTPYFDSLSEHAKSEGYKIIALIDSLDSFALGEDPLSKMPDNIFVVATSLIERADELARKHQSYALLSLEDFSRHDAEEMISRTFSANLKELPEDIREALLSKCNTCGTPSYSSPLWLNLALSMLMELGDEDFRAIHKIDSDTSKSIHKYLLEIIQSLPGDADELFTRFIDMSCNYFDPELTIMALTYIAIAPFGIEERQLAAILGDRWNSLEFESLRQWFGSNLRIVGNDRILKLSHNILSASIANSSDERVIEARARLTQSDWEDYLDGQISLDEIVRRLIYRSEYDAMRVLVSDCYDKLCNQGVYDFATAVFNVLQHDIYTVVRFVDGYFRMFNDYDLYDTELVWLNDVKDLIWSSKMKEKDTLTEEFSNVTTRYNSHYNIFKGDICKFGEYLSHENDYDAWRWALDINLEMYGPRIVALDIYWCFAKSDTRLLEMIPILQNDKSRMPEFIEKYVEAIEIAERIKSILPDNYGEIRKGIDNLNGYLTNIFIGWHFETNPYHSVQVELKERMRKLIEMPFTVKELPPLLKPSPQEVEEAIREYKSRFHPSEIIKEEITPWGKDQLMAQAEILAILGDREAALNKIEEIPVAERHIPSVLDWLVIHYPDAEILHKFYKGRFEKIMEDIIRGCKIDLDEISRIIRMYYLRGEKEKALDMLLIESEILLLHQMNTTFHYDDMTYSHDGNYSHSIEYVKPLYQRLVKDLLELELFQGVEEVLCRWMEMCDLTFIDRPWEGSYDYDWAEERLKRFGYKVPPRKYVYKAVSDKIFKKVENHLYSFSKEYPRLYHLYRCGYGDILKAVYAVQHTCYIAIFSKEGEPLSLLDEYRSIVDFGFDEFSLAGESGFWKFMRRDGKIAFDGTYEAACKFSEGLAAVSGEQRAQYPRKYYWGFIDTTGKEIIPKIYEEVGDFHYGKAWAVKDGRYGVIDTHGNTVVNFDYDIITSFYRGHAYAFKNGTMEILR